MKGTAATILLAVNAFSYGNGSFLHAESSSLTPFGRQSTKNNDDFATVRRLASINPNNDEKVGTKRGHEERDGKKKRKNKSSRGEEYERRKQLWMERYGTLEALQSTFGTGRSDTGGRSSEGGFFSGDLSPEQTRFLYHTLLPRSLVGLYEMKLMRPEELAPLAFQARIAAKQYARSRCVWYARAATTLFDQYRNIRDKRGLGKSGSMTWEEIWSKYEAQIVQEACEEELEKYNNDDDDSSSSGDSNTTTTLTEKQMKKFREKDLTMRIYLRILEKSCATNKAFDAMFLKNNHHDSSDNIDEEDRFLQISNQLDQDVREILLRPKDIKKLEKETASREKKNRKTERKEEERQKKTKAKRIKHRIKAKKKKQKEEEGEIVESPTSTESLGKEEKQQTQKEEHRRWQVLRILAGTRHKFRQIRQKDAGSSNND